MVTTIVAGAGGSCPLGLGSVASGSSGQGSSLLVNAGVRGIVINDTGGGMKLELGGHWCQAR